MLPKLSHAFYKMRQTILYSTLLHKTVYSIADLCDDYAQKKLNTHQNVQNNSGQIRRNVQNFYEK